MSFSKTALVLLFVLVLSQFSSAAFAMSEEERNFLLMYFKEEELQVVSATRSLKSISRVAENVEVVTKDDIELMNAHTLADVLNTINGVVVAFAGGSPGSIGNASIQGSALEHVVVFMDGVAINLIASDQADIASIPVQMIEKVEVVKGPASSVWGSSLGGVINVITKKPGGKEGLKGAVSISYGEVGTSDFRAEMVEKKNDFGFYLYVGRLHSGGLRPKEEITFNDLYTKFTYDITSRTNVGVTLFYNNGSREIGDIGPPDIFTNKREDMFATFSLNSSLTEGLDLSISLRAARQRFVIDDEMSDGTVAPLSPPLDDRKYGASARLTYKAGIHNVVVGTDYDYKKEVSAIYGDDMPSLNVLAAYANDTITVGAFSITPGFRYDDTDRHNDFASPSLGATWEFFDKTLLRIDIARGFHLPNLALIALVNPDLKPEKVWSYQAGIESALLKYVWLKVSAFRDEIRDAIGVTFENTDKARRQGLEAELKTAKFHNFTFSAGATYVNSEDLSTGQKIHGFPDYTYDLGLRYDDERSFRALLKGRYAWWQNNGGTNPQSDFVVDLNLRKTLIRKENRMCEVYLTGHNIFNGSQYFDELYKNAGRWVEAGLSFKF